jgi:murein DD-endopeptidase MepM/ murein hydrolase activator NlpD
MHNPVVSQGFGTTCWSNRLYGGREHAAIDMYNQDDLAVMAVEEGKAYFYRGGQAAGNGVFIFHPNGKMTLYWHLQ